MQGAKPEEIKGNLRIAEGLNLEENGNGHSLCPKVRNKSRARKEAGAAGVLKFGNIRIDLKDGFPKAD